MSQVLQLIAEQLSGLPFWLALTVLFVASALLASLWGKLKAVFDRAVTFDNFAKLSPHALLATASIYAALGVGAALWLYMKTDLHSLPVRSDRPLHPFGEDFMRRSDWYIVGFAHAFPLMVLMLANAYSAGRAYARAYILTVVPLTLVLMAVAYIAPTFLTSKLAPPSMQTFTGIAWWFTGVGMQVCLSGLLPAVAPFLWFRIRGRRD